jgi:hypothetical protein
MLDYIEGQAALVTQSVTPASVGNVEIQPGQGLQEGPGKPRSC